MTKLVESDLTVDGGSILHVYDTGTGDRHGTGPALRGSRPAVAPAATYAAQVADTLGLHRFAVMGHSGGGPHALACAALLPGRVIAAVNVASLAPCGAADLDYFAGMCASGRRWRRQRRGAR